MTIVREGHRIAPPRTEDDQRGVEHAKVSPDGHIVGWLALTGGWPMSYPLPAALVLFRDGKVIRRINLGPPIWDWEFAPGSQEVVTQQVFPHGPEYFTFTDIRIRDGKQLSQYRCDQDEIKHRPRPIWSRVVKVECPEYMPPPSAASAP